MLGRRGGVLRGLSLRSLRTGDVSGRGRSEPLLTLLLAHVLVPDRLLVVAVLRRLEVGHVHPRDAQTPLLLVLVALVQVFAWKRVDLRFPEHLNNWAVYTHFRRAARGRCAAEAAAVETLRPCC